MSGDPSDASVLERLYAVIESRRTADPAQSHTAALFAEGPRAIAKKLGEEAVETVIEGADGDKARLVSESADLLYHLLVLWAARGVEPTEVWAELERRRGTSGIAEKAARKSD
ncbi:MAG: phosphoribosyl-ATP diphosphatase [Kiloniellales bacterium]|jgi:phosphoribosyl-ATP pyrophosphohydrolase